jgi:hypothetical protein
MSHGESEGGDVDASVGIGVIIGAGMVDVDVISLA